jgi:UDP-N-acetylmuramoylalanine--D-glutamate ligase
MGLPSVNIRIGIWGFGRVGRSVAEALLQHGYQIAVMDSSRKVLSDNLLQEYNVPTFVQEQHDEFFNMCPQVMPSPGIDLRGCALHKHTWLAELDLFQALWKKPIIAITGSVGKTTVASMLADICNHNGISVALGGNIGNAACTLLESHPTADYALLELSSFQLEQCRSFVPDIAIITNLYENHLDRHDSYEAYWHAKAEIFRRQSDHGIVIAPWELRERMQLINNEPRFYYMASQPSFSSIDESKMSDQEMVFSYDAESAAEEIEIYKTKDYRTQIMPKELLLRTLPQNALSLYTALHSLTHNNVLSVSFALDYVSREHRLEEVATKHGITFVNDSKATTVASTRAAVARYKDRRIILFIGGLSKGVNRELLIATLPSQVIHLVCFGAEAAELAHWATEHHKASSAHTTLQEAFTHVMMWAEPETVVLLSPSGSSFDLYMHYEARGAHFKQLVREFIDTP